MDLITKSPGLQHIAEKIFFNLDTQSYLRTPKSSESLAHHLGKCKHVNENWKNIIENPLFLFKACVQKRLLSEKLRDIFQKVRHSRRTSFRAILGFRIDFEKRSQIL